MKYIKLFEEHSYSAYDLITMGANRVLDLLTKEIQKKYSDLELIKDILEYSVIDINSKNSNGWTALTVATDLRKEKVVELLLSHPGIDVNVQSKSALTALMLATYRAWEKCVELLLSHPGIDVNVQNEGGWTALMYATATEGGYEKEKFIELLLNHPGIDVNLQTKIGRTAWDMASGYIRQKFPQLKPDFQ
jgi:ankyrin repeat protein